MGQVLAAQREHQHSAGVGVADQRSQQLAGLGMVMAGLGAAEGMGEGVQAVDGAGDQILVVPHEGFGAVVDAADGGDVLTCLDGSDGHLVALGDVLNSGDGGVIHGDSGALGDGVQGNGHVIFGVDLNSDGHNKTISLI